ncbi:hypothetical protein BDM02DRAFT_3189459 [Thelephora ganbajun]|uniref:Uncharacterized protein n=1 Tax=Thelephora ganbajun TaxID=370292 RepID=A0ACB6Z996_THEGA|nr:hypothetical protein BDM02DRAFT_3189459 [Thelephora ganbajun]
MTFLVVSQFPLISKHPMQNIYRRFGFASGHLYTEGHATLWVIRASDVICHFVRTPVESEGQGLMHALPLNQKLYDDYHIPDPYETPDP